METIYDMKIKVNNESIEIDLNNRFNIHSMVKIPRLTDEEIKILQLYANGVSPGEIDKQMFFSKAARYHRQQSIFGKMGISKFDSEKSCLTLAIATALRLGIIK